MPIQVQSTGTTLTSCFMYMPASKQTGECIYIYAFSTRPSIGIMHGRFLSTLDYASTCESGIDRDKTA